MNHINLPPEVYGCLSVAQRNLNAAATAGGRYRWRAKERKARHIAKVQKLVAKAARMLPQGTNLEGP